MPLSGPLRLNRGQCATAPGPRRACRVRWSLAALVLLLTMPGCDRGPEPPLRVATIEWIGYQPLQLARNSERFPTEAIRIAEFTSNTESLRAFRNGNVEVAALTLDEALLLRADGHDIRILLLMDYSAGADTILARPGIESLAELAGHRIGVENSAATAYLLARALEFGGLDAEAVEIVRVDAGRHEQAFRSGEVDALATFEPIRTRLLDSATELFDSTRIPGEIVDVLVAHREALERHRQGLNQLLRAWFAALQTLKAEPERSHRTMAQYTDLSAAEFARALDGVEFPSLAENCTALARDGRALRISTTRLNDLMQEHGLLTRRVDLEQLYDDRILQTLGCPDAAAGAPG